MFVKVSEHRRQLCRYVALHTRFAARRTLVKQSPQTFMNCDRSVFLTMCLFNKLTFGQHINQANETRNKANEIKGADPLTIRILAEDLFA